MVTPACRSCRLPFNDPDVFVAEDNEGREFCHIACFFLKKGRGRFFCGVAVLSSKPNPELDSQAIEFGHEIVKKFDRGEIRGESMDLSRWPLVAEIVTDQQDRIRSALS